MRVVLLLSLVLSLEGIAAAQNDAARGGRRPAQGRQQQQRQQPMDVSTLSFEGSRAEIYKRVGDVELKIHIFDPPGHQASDKRAAVVFFFGGGWRSGSPKQFEHQCRYLASRGMVAMTADYRVSSRHMTQAKECVQDGKSAVRWVRTNAERLGIDPERIAAGGGSAGGHVAACTGVIEGWDEPGEANEVSSLPNALVLYNPALALAEVDGQQAVAEDRAGDLVARCGTDPKNISPAHHVHAGLPPTIHFFGTKDFLIAGARHFQSEMKQAGNHCELVLYDGQSHGFFNFGREKNVYFAKTLRETDRFLSSLGYLTGEATVDEFMKSVPPGNARD